MNKNQSSSALYRGLGSIAIVGCAQTALLLTRDHTDPLKRILSVTKNNLGAHPKAREILLRPEGKSVRLEWGGESQADPEQVLRGEEEQGRRDGIEDCKRLLAVLLAQDWKPATEILAEAEDAGLKERTLRAAKAVLGVRSRRVVVMGKAMWEWGPPESGWAKWGQTLDRPPDM